MQGIPEHLHQGSLTMLILYLLLQVLHLAHELGQVEMSMYNLLDLVNLLQDLMQQDIYLHEMEVSPLPLVIMQGIPELLPHL